MAGNGTQSSREKLEKLRTAMAAAGLDGYLVPMADEFQCEYVPENAKRVKWLSGFSGSAGNLAVLKDAALACTDARYTDQIGRQVDSSLYDIVIADEGDEYIDWILKNTAPGSTIGFDPMLVTVEDFEDLKESFDAQNITLKPVPGNLVDGIWTDRPDAPESEVYLFPESLAGRTADDNRAMVAGKVKAERAKAVIINKPDSIIWFLNVRADDVEHTPLALSYVVTHEDGKVDWFIEPSRVPPHVCQKLGAEVTIRPPQEMEKAVGNLARAAAQEGKSVLLDSHRAPFWFKYTLEEEGAVVKNREDPIVRPRACKSKSEMDAIIEGHIRDGVALAKFTKWLEETAPQGTLTEKSVADRLEAFRREDTALRDLSFPTISGWNENGAVIHYNVNEEPDKNKQIRGRGALLIDSGGQYLSEEEKVAATTDVTITRAVGDPDPAQVRIATIVLKGFIRLASARFAEGTKGIALQYLAREEMEKHGLVCPHGVGHGVGCYAGVHEDASALTTNVKRSSMSLMPGMLLSNEPGAYFSESWGCRLERLQRVVADGTALDGETKMYKFDVVTLTPFDRKLIDANLLREEELQWLNDYHERVYRTLAQRLDKNPAVKDWLYQATAPLKKNLSPGWAPGWGTMSP